MPIAIILPGRVVAALVIARRDGSVVRRYRVARLRHINGWQVPRRYINRRGVCGRRKGGRGAEIMPGGKLGRGRPKLRLYPTVGLAERIDEQAQREKNPPSQSASTAARREGPRFESSRRAWGKRRRGLTEQRPLKRGRGRRDAVRHRRGRGGDRDARHCRHRWPNQRRLNRRARLCGEVPTAARAELRGGAVDLLTTRTFLGTIHCRHHYTHMTRSSSHGLHQRRHAGRVDPIYRDAALLEGRSNDKSVSGIKIGANGLGRDAAADK